MAVAGRLIPVQVGDVLIQVEAVPVAGTEPTAGRVGKAAESVLEAFDRAQDAIVAVAKSTAQVIERADAAARPDRLEVEFGLKLSASGGVIMAGAAGEATLKVTLGYDVSARPAASAGEKPDAVLEPAETLGDILAQDRGDYDEAARQYQRALAIDKRLGNQAAMATTYSQMGSLVQERGGPAAESIALHMRALTIRVQIGAPQAWNNLRRLAAYRRELGNDAFGHLDE